MGKNSQCHKTIKAATQYCLNQELEFLYIKKQELNERLYRIHLECVSSWQNNWHMIQASIDDKLQWRIDSHYNHLNRVPSWSCSKAVHKPVWHNTIAECTVNKLLMMDELSQACRVSCHNKFVKLVHLVGFIIKKLPQNVGNVYLCAWCHIPEDLNHHVCY
jgi:hypothetical protein